MHSPPLRVAKDARRGRFYVAARPIRSDELVLEARPQLFVPGWLWLPHWCAGCRRFAPRRPHRQACDGCNAVRFCSSECGQADHMCAEMARLQRLDAMARDAQTAWLASQCCDADDAAIAAAYEVHEILDIALWWVMHCQTPPLHDSALLESNVPQWTASDRRQYELLFRLLCGWPGEPLARPPHQWSAFAECMGVRQCNAFAMWHLDDEITALGLYPAAALFNHACRPNVRRESVLAPAPAGPTLRFYATQDVAQDQPLCHAYVSFDEPQRRQKLRERYYFECVCDACVQG